MIDNPVQFAVVREDPIIEIELAQLAKANSVLLIASGGCTALSMASILDDVNITLVDPNVAQFDLIRKKIKVLRTKSSKSFKRDLNIGYSNNQGLNACGNFESLFKGFREFIFEMVADYDQLRHHFTSTTQSQSLLKKILKNTYWSAAFDLFFCDSLLNSMFGKEATQHAAKGSYPRYFRKKLEEGLTLLRHRKNYFMHHIFLGHYLDQRDCLPPYLLKPPQHFNFEFINEPLEEIRDFAKFQLISVSNIFDWMGDSSKKKLSKKLRKKTSPECIIAYRQLNNTYPIERLLEPELKFDKQLSKQLTRQDRSLFYSRIGVCRKL